MVNRYTVVSKTNSVAQRKEIVNIMANHSIDTKAVDSFPRNGLVVRILIALGILALVIVTAQTVANRNEPSPVAPASKTSEQTFSTQQYWDKAAEYEASKAAAAVESPATFSTQQYWDKAAEYEASKAAAAVESPATFSTQQYWDKAAEYEARKAAEQEAAREAALLAEPEWSYYTEQYWAKTR